MKKVLIIDDDASTGTMLKRILREEKISILTARNGEDGLRMAGEIHPDLVILDINMPGISGFQVCEEIKRGPLTRKIPVVFHSVNSRIADRKMGISLGAEEYLLKPVRPQKLLEIVRTYI